MLFQLKRCPAVVQCICKRHSVQVSIGLSTFSRCDPAVARLDRKMLSEACCSCKKHLASTVTAQNAAQSLAYVIYWP
jgi:hypothetical protein